MKATIKTQEEKTFKPITIEIVIESKEELAELYARINAAINKIEYAEHQMLPMSKTHSDTQVWGLWDKLNTIIDNL